MKKDENDIINWLQNWLAQYCDGDWEHNENIKIFNIDNPGWGVKINLEGTQCEKKIYPTLEVEISEDQWYHCFVREGKFQGAGGVHNLYDILRCFKIWVENCQKDIG